MRLRRICGWCCPRSRQSEAEDGRQPWLRHPEEDPHEDHINTALPVRRHTTLGLDSFRLEDTRGLNEDDDDLFASVLIFSEICQERVDMSMECASEEAESVVMSVEPTSQETLAACVPGDDISLTSIELEDVSKGDLEDVLRELRNTRKVPDVTMVLRVCQHAQRFFRKERSTLVRIPAPADRLIVVGDLHGHFNDLLHVLNNFGEPHDSNQYLFNGDFVDRGVWGVELILVLFCLQLLHPTSVFLNRGNHESPLCNDRYGFKEQIVQAFPDHHVEVYTHMREAFDQLPLCYVIGEKVFVVHGGLPLEPLTLEFIERIPRGPMPQVSDTKEDRAFRCFLWSDPAAVPGISNRGAGCHFAERHTRAFLRENGLACIVRSHECVPSGMQSTHGGLVTTVFSASNYTSENSNKGCVVIIKKDLQVQKGTAWNEPYVHDGESWNCDDTLHGDAAESLRKRASSARDVEQSTKSRALEELRRMIFQSRPQLLELFEEMDAELTGKVPPACWAEAMARCFKTPSEFPWRRLGRHLFELGADGRVAYVPFLLRYDNPFSSWVGDQWCARLLKHVAFRLKGAAGAEFDRLDTNKSGKLSYTALRRLAYQSMPVTRNQATTQAFHVFTLFCKMNAHQDGFVTREEFVAAIEDAEGPATHCPNKHLLSEVHPGVFSCCARLRQCNKCSRYISRRELLLCCTICDYDLCQNCITQYLGPDVAELEEQWSNAEMAIRTLCRSRCDVRAVFAVADANRDGWLDKQEFVALVRDLLQGNEVAAERLWSLVCEYDDRAGHKEGRLWIDDFRKCLEIMDVQPPPPTSSLGTTIHRRKSGHL